MGFNSTWNELFYEFINVQIIIINFGIKKRTCSHLEMGMHVLFLQLPLDPTTSNPKSCTLDLGLLDSISRTLDMGSRSQTGPGTTKVGQMKVLSLSLKIVSFRKINNK